MRHLCCRGKSCRSSSGFDRREDRAWQLPGSRASLPSSPRATWLGDQNQELGDLLQPGSTSGSASGCAGTSGSAQLWLCLGTDPHVPTPNLPLLLAWRTAQQDNSSCALPLLCPTPPSANPGIEEVFYRRDFPLLISMWGRSKPTANGLYRGLEVQTDLNEHVADVHVARLGCSMERGSLTLMLHFKIRVNSIHCKTEQRHFQAQFRD